MKKRDLLLAGLFLFSVSAFAQDDDSGLGPNGETEPPHYSDDAEVIFIQDFEGSSKWDTIRLNQDPNRPTTLYTWQVEPVDTIKQVAYYKRNYDGKNTGNPGSGTDIYNGEKQWEIAGVRDTLMLLYSGVMRTDAVQPDDSILGAQDKHMISFHDGETLTGQGLTDDDGLRRFGENEHAGSQYFTYISGKSDGVANASSGKTPDYRRNLFVRLDPGTIQERSSYRVTVFVRAKSIAKLEDNYKTPNMALDLMRGYFHSEKSFLVSNKGDRNTFSDKTDYNIYGDGTKEGMWQKITLMAYYNNDSVGNASAYLLGYYWADDWNWVTPINAETGVVEPGSTDTATLKFVQQPDKYFVRMAFRSDSTRFDVENLSLTKSWIGGVEHYEDMIRVNFGYETNMPDLAAAAEEKNKIPAVELPGEYFDVWAKFWDNDEKEYYWEYMPVLSAEYHGKYLYMWSKPYSGGYMRDLNTADSVLVSFRNPLDRDDLKLVYKGNYYPNGLDEEWIANGKPVFDFHNEISSLNPTITKDDKGKTVRSLKNLPPVLQASQFAEGTFGLKGDIDSIEFKFSRQVYSKNTGDNKTNSTYVVVSGKYTEYWTIKSYDGGRTVIYRPAADKAAHGDLEGDYLIFFDQVTHLADAVLTDADDYGKDVELNVHFGPFVKNPEISTYYKTNWNISENVKEAVCWGTAIIDASNKNYTLGKGQKGSGSRLYRYSAAGQMDCAYYLCPRGNSTDAHLYVGVSDSSKYRINLQAGIYQLSFFALGWDGKAESRVYVYPAPEEGTPDQLDVDKKTLLGKFTPNNYIPNSDGKNTSYVISTADAMTYTFRASTTGNYIIEFEMPKAGNWNGTLYSDLELSRIANLSVSSVVKLNEAIAAADERIKLADDNPSKYKGAKYDALVSVREAAVLFIDTVATVKGHTPLEYDSVVNIVNQAIDVMQKQIDTVDAFYQAYDAAVAFKDSSTIISSYGTTFEYSTLVEVVEIAGGIVPASTTNEVLASSMAEMSEAIKAVKMLAYSDITTKRIALLDSLAKALGVVYNSDLEGAIPNAVTDDDNLADVMKEAIVEAIYNRAAAGNKYPVDMTGFIKNYHLYATPILNEVSSISKDNGNTLKNATINTPGAQIQHIEHRWNTNQVWGVILDKEFDNLYPGWNFRADNNNGSGNRYVTPDDEGYPTFTGEDEAKYMVFDGQLAMDWNSKAELKQTVTGLPIGMYSLGINLKANGKPASTTLEANADGQSYKATASDGAGVFSVDSIKVGEEGEKVMSIDFVLASGDNWSKADNFTLTFTPLEDFDYSKVATIVDFAQVEAAGEYEYYTLNWIKVEYPEKNQIYFRKSGNVVEKVIFK